MQGKENERNSDWKMKRRKMRGNRVWKMQGMEMAGNGKCGESIRNCPCDNTKILHINRSIAIKPYTLTVESLIR